MIVRAAALFLLLTAAGPAVAETTPDNGDVARAMRAAAFRADARPAFTVDAIHARALSSPGIARTAAQTRLSDGGLTGSMGFLCGLGPGFKDNGPTGADPHGRFLGLKVSMALR